jgi:hypothetical protein
MARFRLAALLIVVVLVAPGRPPSSAQGDKATDPDKKQDSARQRIQQLLDEQLVETKAFQVERPLSEFLTALEKQLPKEKKVSLRIDGEAFGDKLAEIAATPIVLPAQRKTISLRRVLEVVVAKSKIKLDYRLDGKGVALTTPQRAQYTAVYDIRDIVAKPEAVISVGFGLHANRDLDHLRNTEPAQKAALVVHMLGVLDFGGEQGASADQEAIQILNGNRLVVHANAARHALIAEMLQALRRLGDVAVIMQARLYEVDDAFYTKLKNTKYQSAADLAELEKKATGDEAPGPFMSLEKQKLILAGDELKVDNGAEVALLSRHQVVRCLPGPDQVGKDRQTILDGVSILAGVQVTGDRRFVRVKLTEKDAVVEAVEKLKIWFPMEQDKQAESPIMKESTHSRVRLIPDGGSILLPVHYRPRAAEEKKRWWVLSISPRIYIPEEEQASRDINLTEILPALLADVLSNPRLKTTREFYGSPDDKRFALVDSDAWTWPEKIKPAVPGWQMVKAERMGKRLLGIRLDQSPDANKENPTNAITVTLVNAGGSANGAVLGGCTIRYIAKPGAKGWVVELAEPRMP